MESARNVFETVIGDDLAGELADLASVWADLLLVGMSLHERKQMQQGSQLFARRALWEQAVVAYGRCFKTGPRRQLPDRLRAQMVGGSVRVHDEVLRWRDKHVAHRVDKELEWTSISLTYPEGESKPRSVRVRVQLPMGPEDDRLADALAELAGGLKDRLWEQWFPELERAILERYGTDIAARAAASLFQGHQRPNTYAVTIDPSGRRT
jgi:hypothetical protein